MYEQIKIYIEDLSGVRLDLIEGDGNHFDVKCVIYKFIVAEDGFLIITQVQL